MKRETAIKKLLGLIKKETLAKVTDQLAQNEKHNFVLQLLNSTYTQSPDVNNNWFTALAVLFQDQKLFAVRLLRMANTANGNPPMTNLTKTGLIDAIAAGSKLTKADAR